MGYTSEQLNNARTIINVGRQRGASGKVILAALATGLVESDLHNATSGDLDSLGVFQQRPSQGWGSPSQVRNVRYAANKFYDHAIPLRNKYHLGALAQAVQRSAYPDRYAQRQGEASQLFHQLGGSAGGAARGGSARGAAGTTRITKTVTPGVDNSGLRNQLKFQYLSQAPASPFSQKNLTPGKLPDLSKAAAVPSLSAPNTAPDPMKYLGQANAKTNALLSLAGNLQGAQDVAPTSRTVTQRTPGTPASGGGGGGGGKKWSQPVPGVAMGRTDNGVDFEAPVGTKLRALGAGTIVNNDGGFPGSLVLKLDRPLPNGQRFIYYGHLQRGDMLARVGQRVSAGQVVARTSRSPVDAGDMPGHTEIGIARDAGGAPQIGRHVETGESSWGRYFAHVLRNLRG